MNRLLATTAAAALCAAWSIGTSAWADADATTLAPTPAPAADSAAQPKTLQDAINVQVAAAKSERLQGHLDEAAKAFVQLMLVAPTDPAVLGEYGKTLAQQGHSQDAVVLLTRAVALQTGDWTYYSALGVAYDQLGKRKEAREAYDRALAIKPGEPSVLNNYALSRMLAGDYAGARKMFEQIQAMGTNDPKIAANLARLDTLEGAHGQRTAAAAPAAKAPATPNFEPAHAAPVAVATLASPAPTGRVIMEKVPVDPLAGPVGKREATHAPVALASAAPRPAMKAPTAPVKMAVAEKINPATTIMEKVPVDPLAGPVAPHAVAAVTPKKPVVKVAHEARPKVLAAAKPQTSPKSKTVLAKAALSPPPALRTASESN
jgi:Flp pilus assembly protein TadD